MSYNPHLDLIYGIMLIFLPFVVLAWLSISYMVIERDKKSETTIKTGPPETSPPVSSCQNDLDEQFKEALAEASQTLSDLLETPDGMPSWNGESRQRILMARDKIRQIQEKVSGE